MTKHATSPPRFVVRYPVGEYANDATYEIEELLWEAREPYISPRVRRELASALDQVELSRRPTRFLMCYPNCLSSIRMAFRHGTSAAHSTGESVSM